MSHGYAPHKHARAKTDELLAAVNRFARTR